jgi:competence protein ComEC
MKRLKWWLIGIVGVLIGGIGGVLWYYSDTDTAHVRFLDVGQGDAILISRGTNQILIDGGRDPKVLLGQLGRALPFWDRDIEAVILTHPDEDHIGGLLGLKDRYRVGQWLTTGATTDTATWKRLSGQLEPLTEIRQDSTIRLGEGETMTILWPRLGAALDAKDTNASSIVARLDLGREQTFLLTGDLTSKQEPEVAAQPTTVLKAGHHGSKYSTSDAWLDRVQPQDTILSVGAQNRYGHPAAETLERLLTHHTTPYRTDRQGTITYTCHPNQARCTVTTER